MTDGIPQVEMDEVKLVIKNRDTVLKLISTPEWKKVIEELYFKDEALRLVDGVGDLRLTIDQRDNVKNMMLGMSSLKNFIGMLLNSGTEAEQSLQAMEDESQEALFDE